MSKSSLSTCPQRLPSGMKPVSSYPRLGRDTKLSFRRRLQYYYWRLRRLQGRPEALARGLACGVFAGLFPLFGLQTILGVLLAIPLRGNKIMAAAGTWVSNPLTYVPIYAFNFKVGQWLLRDSTLTKVSLQSWQEVMALGSEIISTVFVGCLAMGLVGAVCSYFLGLALIRRFRASHRKS